MKFLYIDKLSLTSRGRLSLGSSCSQPSRFWAWNLEYRRIRLGRSCWLEPPWCGLLYPILYPRGRVHQRTEECRSEIDASVCTDTNFDRCKNKTKQMHTRCSRDTSNVNIFQNISQKKSTIQVFRVVFAK